MKPFSFRLETLLRLRQAERDARLAELAQVLREARELEVQWERFETECRQQQSRDRELRRSGDLSVEALRRSAAFRARLGARHEQLAALRDDLEQRVGCAQAAVAEVQRELEAISKLCERQSAEHSLAARRAEGKALDEVSAGTFRSRGR